MDLFTIQLIIIIVCFFLSAFFSGSETALFSLKKSDLHKFSISKSKTQNAIYKTMVHPQKILITILIGNLIVNVFFTMASTNLFIEKWPNWGEFITIAVLTPIMIILCEISPKVISINLYEYISKKVYPLLSIFHILFFPFRILLLFVTNSIIKIFKLKEEDHKITEDELGHAINIGAEEGAIDKEEGEFIKNVLMFSKKEASNVMFPRNRALFIPYGSKIEEAMDLFNKYGVIRAPVYKKDLDHVVGVIDSRDLLPYFKGYKKASTINKFIEEVKFYPESRELNDLLQDFLREGIQVAIVVDEYGGTAGIVTLNSILAELLGKDFNRWEIDYKPEVRKIDDNLFFIPGDMQINDFNMQFDVFLESQELESVGGYIIERLSRIPLRGDEINVNGYSLKVKHIVKNRIETIEVRRIGADEE